jgi:hypothetical protein
MSDALLPVATIYRTIHGVLGCYLTARLAPNRPMLHASILGATRLAVSIAGVVVAWNRVAECAPPWYPLALLVLAMPHSWAGWQAWCEAIGSAASGITSPGNL